jgi:hypothetical protein
MLAIGMYAILHATRTIRMHLKNYAGIDSRHTND